MEKLQHTNDRYYRHGRFAIPAQSGAALDFYLRRLLVPRSRREMLFAPLARQSRAVGQLLFTENGENSGFGSRANGGARLSPGSLTKVLAERLESAGVEIEGSAKLLLLGDYVHSARGQSVVFVFDERAKTPVAVAKTGSAAHRESLEREFRTLEDLARILPPPIARTVPQPIDLFADSGFTILLESALPGASVYFEMRNRWRPRRLIENHFSKAFGWLADFHRATLTRRVSFEDLRRGEFAGCFEKLRRDCETSDAEDVFIGEMMTAAAVFDGEEIPLSMAQGDFWTRNILVDGEKIGVVDWERARAEGFSLDDAFMFAISYGRGYPWKFGQWLAPEAAFARTFYGNSRFTETVAGQFANLCRELKVPGKLLGFFLAVFLARQAVEEASMNGKAPAAQTEPGSAANEKEVTPWRNLFREYAAAAKKHVCFG